MLVDGYSGMKPFLPACEMKGEPEIFDDALEVAQESLVNDIIGAALETQLELHQAADAKLLKNCQRVISLQAFLKSIPDMDLVLTDAGFGVINNEKFAMASKDRVAALTQNVARKLDDAKDALITFLLRTSDYDDWRGTEEFARLSDGLILTFTEFKDVAVLNAVTRPFFPDSWGGFFALNSALNVALMTDVAALISKDYAEEILERIRDNETFLPIEKKVVRLVKIAIAAIALGDRETGMAQAVAAAAIMKANPNDFPTYIESKEFKEAVKLEHKNTPIFSMF